MNTRLIIVLILGFSSGLPLAMLTSTLQAWFASDGLSLMKVGVVSLIGLPYCYRFMWAPILDKYPLFSLGRRRSWILTMQILLLIGFNIITWFSPTISSNTMLWLAALLAFFSATLDIAIDAHRTEYLPVQEHALGASFAIFGYRMALLLAGGLSLVIAAHWGWVISYRCMGSLMIIGISATIFSKEPLLTSEYKEVASASFLSSLINPVKCFIQQKNILLFLVFILCYKLGESFTSSTSGIVLPFLIQGLGFPLDVIGYINKIVGITAAILGGIVSGFILLRWNLFSALLCFGICQALSTLSFIALAIFGKDITLLCIAVVSENFASGLCAVALVALFMRVVDRRYTATQFSILIAFASLPRTFSGPIAAMLQSHLGWTGFYQLVFCLSLLFIPFLLLLYYLPSFSFNHALNLKNN